MIEHDAEILYEVEGAAAQRAAMEREAAEREAHMEADSAAEVSDEADEEGEPEEPAP
jgi:hypothetical protein